MHTAQRGILLYQKRNSQTNRAFLFIRTYAAQNFLPRNCAESFEFFILFRVIRVRVIRVIRVTNPTHNSHSSNAG